ncbi:MAG: C39 family peptidase [Deltaproteobacteria bacterium]|nr:C39 family peptidase [Deltaproteobacteria bacterium]
MASRRDLPDIETIRGLYDAHRYLDAYALTRDAWRDRSLAAELDVPALLLAGRLARRLGSGQFSEALFRLAAARAPELPEVIYYCAPTHGVKSSLYNLLARHEARHDLGSDDPELDASWCAQHALLLAAVHDFERARARLADARALHDGPWTLACAATVALGDKQWAEALTLAEEAWARSPGLGQAAVIISGALTATGRAAEAAERWLTYAEDGQSRVVLELGMHEALMVAQRDGPSATALVAHARQLAPRLEILAPLADRSTRYVAAHLQAELAKHAGDRQSFLHHTEALPTPYHRALVSNIKANPDGRRWILPHTPVRQRHKSCLPASVACALSHFGVELNQEALAQQVTYDGTPYWRVVDWAHAQGLVTRQFLMDGDTARVVLQAGLPFVFSLNSMSNAHACTALGLDEAAGTLLLHDPGVDFMREMLLSRVDQGDAPVGPAALIIAPAALEPKLAALDLTSEDEARAMQAFVKALDTGGTDQARAVQTGLAAKAPGSAPSRYLEALVAFLAAKQGRAIELLQGLLQQHPHCIPVKRMLLDAITARRDPAALRAFLEAVLSERQLPGLEGSQGWLHPEAGIYTRLADSLRHYRPQVGRAETLLQKALLWAPEDAAAYHVLADLLATTSGPEASLLPARVAATLEPEDEHYASTYAELLRRCGRGEEALAWLERRVERASEAGGGATWVTLVSALEQLGHPERALTTVSRAVLARPQDGELAGFAATVFARFGKVEDAARALASCEAHGTAQSHLQAAARVAHSRGDLEAALDLARRWLVEDARSPAAHALVAALTQQHVGADAARALVEGWRAERPQDRELVALAESLLVREESIEDQEARVAARLAEDPLDAWAWREQAWLRLRLYDQAPAAERPRRLADAEAAIRQAVEADPTAAAALALEACLLDRQGDMQAALRRFGRALAADPEYHFPLDEMHRLVLAVPEDQRGELVDILTEAFSGMSRDPVTFPAALELIADALGPTAVEAAAERWRRFAPDHPGLVVGWATALMRVDPSTARAQAILPRLEEASRRFPLDTAVTAALARAHQRAGAPERAAATLEQAAARSPTDAHIWGALVGARWDLGDQAGALDAARSLVRAAPGAPGGYRLLAVHLVRAGDPEGAVEVLEQGILRLPLEISLYSDKARILTNLGRHEEALATAEALVTRQPGDGEAALEHAHLLSTIPGTSRARVLAAYQGAVDRAPGVWPCTDALCRYLVSQGDLRSAEVALSDFERANGSHIYVQGTRAEIRRAGTEPSQALESLAQTLLAEPEYAYGWNLFLRWAEEDEAWPLAQRVLPAMGAGVRLDPEMEARRLWLLARAGTAAAALEPDWARLLANHPRALLPLQLRMDQLLSLRLLPQGRALLERATARMVPGPELEGLWVELEAADDKVEQALLHLERLWRFPDVAAGIVWPALGALARRNALEETTRRLVDALGAARPPAASVRRLLSAVLSNDRRIHDLWILARGLARADLSFDSREELATALRQLCELGEAQDVLSMVDEQRARFEAHTELWAVEGLALLRMGRPFDAAAKLESWRKRPGLTQIVLLIYVSALEQLGRWYDVREAARYALSRLERQSSASNLAAALLAASLSADDHDCMVTDYATFGALLGPASDAAPVPTFLHLSHEALTSTEPRQVAVLHRQVRRYFPQHPWMQRLWRGVFEARLPWWWRLWLFFRR